MARKSDVDRARKHLEIAAKVLQDSHPEVSETLQELRKPFGSRMLVVDFESPRGPENSTNVALLVPVHLRKAIQDAALDAADSDDVKVQELLGAVLNERIRQVLAGELSPREIPREPRGAGVEKVNLNAPVDTAVLAQLRAALPELGARLGYQGKPSVSKIGFRLLLDEYGLDYEPTPNEFKGLSQIQLQVPPRLAAAIQEKLSLVEADLRSLVEEGYAKVLAGSWRPFKIPKAAKGSDYQRESLFPRVDATLVERVRAKCPELKQELGYRVTPPTVAIDYLIGELGLEDLADAEYGITH